MEIVIKLTEAEYKKICFITDRGLGTNVDEAVKNGTLLPKGHSRLIDASSLKTHFIDTDLGTDLEMYLESTIIDAPTIIEADMREVGE